MTRLQTRKTKLLNLRINLGAKAETSRNIVPINQNNTKNKRMYFNHKKFTKSYIKTLTQDDPTVTEKKKRQTRKTAFKKKIKNKKKVATAKKNRETPIVINNRESTRANKRNELNAKIIKKQQKVTKLRASMNTKNNINKPLKNWWNNKMKKNTKDIKKYIAHHKKMNRINRLKVDIRNFEKTKENICSL